MPNPELPQIPQHLLEQAPMGILLLDGKRRIQFCNAAAQALLGRPQPEILGQSLRDILPQVKQAAAQPNAGWQLAELKTKDGQRRRAYLYLLQSVAGAEDHAALFLRELSKQEQDYEGLVEAEAMFTAFMSNNAVLTWMKDDELRYVYANGPYQELLGLDPKEMVGKTDLELRDRATAEELRANDRIVQETGESLETQETLFDVLGEPRYQQVYKFPFEDHLGRRYVGGVSIDITPMKQTEEALRRSEENYRSLFENALDGIYRTTVDGKLLAANPALVRMLGYDSAEELRAVDVASDLYQNPAKRAQLQEQLAREGATRNVEINLKTRDGRVITVLDNSRLVRDEEGKTLYTEGTLTDITALKERERELAAAYDATIEGWSRALDLRDRETRGHTQRVTYVTEKIAREFGFDEQELVHIRRGALLHDIGKMGVPDGVLRKSGALTDEEWDVMRQHPEFARDMLWGIAYLRPALDIPYCHHEKWDGSGYPRGLEKEEIPLAARIFAVADVWDALRSNRPYRDAWSEGKVLAYIRDQAGKHFDPNVVAYFLDNAAKYTLETASLT